MSVPALEVGGSHVTAGLVDPATGTVTARRRFALDRHGAAADLLDRLGAAGRSLGAPAGAAWGIALPGPFDYATGIARYAGVGKFESLNGVDVGAALADRLGSAAISFVNDAVAFGLGEWRFGAGRGERRLVAVTLGTGVGSAWLADGRAVTAGPTVPPGGRTDLLRIDGRPLEDTVSARAIEAAYVRATGERVGLALIAERAAAGDPVAAAHIAEPMVALGRALAPWLARHGATALVVGGAITGSWPLVCPALARGIADDPVSIERAADTEAAALAGAAVTAVPPR